MKPEIYFDNQRKINEHFGKFIPSDYFFDYAKRDEYKNKLDFNFTECFGLFSSIMFNREPSKVEVCNDFDGSLVNFSRCYQNWGNKEKQELEELIKNTEINWDTFTKASNLLWHNVYEDENKDVDEANTEWAWAFWVVLNWIKPNTNIQTLQERYMRVQIEWRSPLYCLGGYDSDYTLFWVNPQFIIEPRNNGKYKHEEERDGGHYERLIDTMLNNKGSIALVSYEDEDYSQLKEYDWVSYNMFDNVYIWLSPRAQYIYEKAHSDYKLTKDKSFDSTSIF
jgi:hypothetical protein